MTNFDTLGNAMTDSHLNELTIDDLNAVTGGVWLDTLVDMVKLIVCYTNGNCTSHGTVLNKR
jgi:bacteriocin-like protein